MDEPANDLAVFFIGMFLLPYIVSAALAPFLFLFFYLKEKFYDAA